ncbi:alpha/beta fold hydrolase [Allokutzneria oryzae]|uniref:Alpha/beta fold hydrolase n=1 Tax=Allokutzneria oryzae TaxID=1378989 RepID=A0ABV6A5Z1_9PSEU
MTAARTAITVRGTRLSFVDFGGPGAPLLALHGHFGRARMWFRIAAELAPSYRVIALEQRAHGTSERGADLHPDSYVADAAAFARKLGLGPMPVVGHSMGGVIAFRLAAVEPGLVSALVVIDSDASTEPPVLDLTGWPRRSDTLEELRSGIEALGIPVADYFLESAVEYEDGWGLLFDYDDMMESQRALLGDRWAEWLSSSACPALLVNGGDSMLLSTETAREMARRRPNTRLAVFPGRGHWVHDEDPAGVGAAIRGFLDETAGPVH